MKNQRLAAAVVILVLCGVVLPLVAQSDPVFLGTFSESFTTFSVVAALTHPGELDWYSFNVTDHDSTIYALSKGPDDEYGLRTLLFDDKGTYIDAAEDQILKVTLAIGTYKIRIDSIKSTVQSYSLVVFNGIEAESNDGILESNVLENIDRETLLVASLLPPGDADFFRFEIPEGGLSKGNNALLIETTGAPAGDTVLILYRYSDVEQRYLPIAFDDDSGDDYWSRVLLLAQPRERYAVRVEETAYPLNGINEYILLIASLALSADDEPNDTLTQAGILVPISPDASAWRIDGLLDTADTIDFYELTIESRALVHIWTEPQPDMGDFDTLLTLYTPSGDRLANNDDSGDSSWSRISVLLDAGTYYVAVEASVLQAALVPYRLQAVAEDVKMVPESEPNDTVETAELIEWAGGEALLIEATIGLEDAADSFRFVLSEETPVVFETGPKSGSTIAYDTTLTLYDEDLTELANNDDFSEYWSRIEETLSAGTYYIVVGSYVSDESFEYTLVITAP